MEKTYQKRPFNQLAPLSLGGVKIMDSFWKNRLEINKDISLPLILEKLKQDHHIDNLKVAAGVKKGTFFGDFYFDSDLYKWLEGGLYFSRFNLQDKIKKEIKEITEIIRKAQWKDGYLNSYYTINFPEKRFTNLLMFHELYSAGHLIEAGIAEKEVTGQRTLLSVARRFGDLLVEKILEPSLEDTAGHPEIELALIKLYRETKERLYLKLCEHLIKMRGRIPHLRTYVMRRLIDTLKTLSKAREKKAEYFEKHPTEEVPKEEVAEFLENLTIKDWISYIRENLNGKEYQLNTPIRKAYQPVGHAVRALYLYSGVADLYSEIGDDALLDALELIWLKMVKARMYITGGVGSNSPTEGFEKDFKLTIEDSYSETCAAIANIMWNWRMFLITSKSKYADLIEKVLYNAMLVGQSLDGKRYFYSNPLVSQGEHKREEWFKCPCCPTNYIRMIPQLGKYIYAKSDEGLYISQYIGSNITLSLDNGNQLRIMQKSHFPWNGAVEIEINTDKEVKFPLFLRIPKWCESYHIFVNGEEIKKPFISEGFVRIERIWSVGKIKLNFEMYPTLTKGDPRRTDLKDKIFISYGPLIYCLEQEDHEFDVNNAEISEDPKLTIEEDSKLMKNMISIKGNLKSGKKFKAIPYFAWNNRGSNKMIIWIKR